MTVEKTGAASHELVEGWHIEDGFDFLGQNVRKYRGKLLIKPSKRSVQEHLAKIREIVKANKQTPAGKLIVQLNPIIRGWALYHWHVASKDTFRKVDCAIFEMIWQWAKRRHPNKGRRWVKDKYFHVIGRRKWTFSGEVEHITPLARGGSNRISNLCLACEQCNLAKGAKSIEEFLKKKPELLKRVLAQAKAPLKDAAAANATRWELFRCLQGLGLPIECGSGGLTKYNRTARELPKTHWLDAACIGTSTPEVLDIKGMQPLLIKACGHGCRHM